MPLSINAPKGNTYKLNDGVGLEDIIPADQNAVSKVQSGQNDVKPNQIRISVTGPGTVNPMNGEPPYSGTIVLSTVTLTLPDGANLQNHKFFGENPLGSERQMDAASAEQAVNSLIDEYNADVQIENKTTLVDSGYLIDRIEDLRREAHVAGNHKLSDKLHSLKSRAQENAKKGDWAIVKKDYDKAITKFDERHAKPAGMNIGAAVAVVSGRPESLSDPVDFHDPEEKRGKVSTANMTPKDATGNIHQAETNRPPPPKYSPNDIKLSNKNRPLPSKSDALDRQIKRLKEQLDEIQLLKNAVGKNREKIKGMDNGHEFELTINQLYKLHSEIQSDIDDLSKGDVNNNTIIDQNNKIEMRNNSINFLKKILGPFLDE